MKQRLSYTLCKRFKSCLFTLGLIACSFLTHAQISLTATAGTTGPVVYPTLKDAFDKVNDGTHQGDVTMMVIGSFTETATATLNATGSGAADYISVLIKPDAGVTATISSAMAGAGPVYLYGASDVTIDGSNTVGGSTQDLTINNTLAGYVIRMGTPSASVACSGIRIRNCILTGNSASSTGGFGVIVSDGGTATLGAPQLAPTNNITIQRNTISTSNRGIVTNGPVALNTNLSILNNQISNCRIAGIQLNNETDATIGLNTISDPVLGVQITNGVNANISSNTINGVVTSSTNTSISSTVNVAGIQIVNGNSVDIRNNNITGPVVLAGGSLRFSGASGSFSGINVNDCQVLTISNNTITGATGVQVGGIPASGIHLSSAIAGAQIFENRISNITNALDSGAYGIFINASGTANAISIYNNFIANSSCPAGNALTRMGHGIYVSRADGIEFYFNSINMNANQPGALSSSPASAAICFDPVSAGAITNTSVVMENNIVVNRQTTGTPYALYSNVAPAIIAAINYNDYFAASGNLGFDGTAAITTLAGMQAAFLGDLNSITFDPQFVSATDLHLLTISANAPLNAGVAIPAITNDIDGATRTVPTIGAHELVVCLLPAITGITDVCVAGTTSLSNTTAGGVWSSNNLAIATISATGDVTGVATGSAVISYTDATCSVTTTVTVGTLPITGLSSICIGTPVPLSDGTPGGVWSSDNTPVATVSATGVVYGVTAGTANISYTFGACPVGLAITVADPPSAITGTATACVGTITILSNASAGGVWSSHNTSIATITSTGDVTGVAAGTADISYTVGTCAAGISVVIGTLPVTGSNTVCINGSTQLSSGTSGGVWASDNTPVATISATGEVFGVTNGTANISYTFGSCPAVGMLITVANPPAAITGAGSICAGSVLTLSNATAGGAWSTANTTIATVSATGDVTGVAAGAAEISYTLSSCTVTETVIVTAPLSTITGSTGLCIGQVALLSNSTSGGVWTSGNTAVATIDPATGSVTAIAPGNSGIVYTSGSCSATVTVTVSTPPAPIDGPTAVCIGSSITLSNSVAGGAWSSDNTTIATISAGGVVTTASAGDAVIHYSIGSCVETVTVTVSPGLSPITGVTSFCTGGTTTLNNFTPGGVWSSSNTTVATVLPGAGDVTAVAVGNAGIIYTLGACSVTTTVTVGVPPGAISGPSDVCESSVITLSSSTPGGLWDTDDPTIAVVSPSGDVTGISAGTVIVDYTDGTCTVTATVTVSPALAPITGSTSICLGGTSALNNTSLGGVWSSSNTTVATVGIGGLVTSAAAGTTTIDYTLGACSVTALVTISNPPPAITGPGSVCVGSTITLANTTPGGVWSSSNATVAAVSAGGVVSGVAAGLATISYSIGGCVVGAPVTVTAALPAISGATAVCQGSTTALSNSVAGGTWSSDNNAVATVSSGGVVSGVAAGTANISYSSGGCSVSAAVTISANSAGTISGEDTVCIGAAHAATLASTVTGGAWSSSNSARATVDATTGLVTGVTSGIFTITYTVNNSCGSFTATWPMYVRTNSFCATGIAPDAASLTDFKVFPNPNQGAFTVSLSSGIDEEVNITITNIVGAKVKEYTGATNKIVNMQLDTPGIYILTAATEHGKYVKKIVIQ